MASVRHCPLPDDAFHGRYSDEGGYADCYAADVAGAVSLQTFIEAFYTSPVLKLELIALGLLFARRSSDDQAAQLAGGETDSFSAWKVEARDERQLLLRDVISGKTRSWLMVAPRSDGTRLYFGSAVLPVGTKADGKPRMSMLFALLGFHRLYSRMLLAGALGRLRQIRGSQA